MDDLKASITLYFNTDDALKGLQKIQGKFSNATNNLQNMFKKISLFSSILTGLSIKGVINQLDELSKPREMFGLRMEDISKFNNLLATVGGTTEEAVEGIESIQKAIGQFKIGLGGPFKELSALIGVSIYKAGGEIKQFDEILDELRLKFKNIDKDAQLEVLSRLGINTTSFLRLLRTSDEEYKELKNTASGMYTMTDKEYKLYIEWVKKLQELKQSFLGVGVSLLEFTQPFLETLKKVLDYFNSLDKGTQKLIAGLMLLGGPILMFGNICKSVLSSTGSLFSLFFKNIKNGMEDIEGIGDFFTKTLKQGSAIGALKLAWDVVNKEGEENPAYKATKGIMDVFGIEQGNNAISRWLEKKGIVKLNSEELQITPVYNNSKELQTTPVYNNNSNINNYNNNKTNSNLQNNNNNNFYINITGDVSQDTVRELYNNLYQYSNGAF